MTIKPDLIRVFLCLKLNNKTRSYSGFFTPKKMKSANKIIKHLEQNHPIFKTQKELIMRPAKTVKQLIKTLEGWHTTTEAAAITGYSAEWFRARRMEQKKLGIKYNPTCAKIGNSYLYLINDLEKIKSERKEVS